MSYYLAGVSGSCADCSQDDPCSEDDCIILRNPGFNTVVENCRLRDVEYVGDQFHVSNNGFYHAIKYNGISYTKGPGFAQAHVTTQMVRTSHSGNTFAALDNLGNIYLYSVNTLTLAITNTAGPIASGMTGFVSDICFLDDDDILLTSVVDSGGGNDTFYYVKGTVTGGGTGMTFSAAISVTYAAASGFLSDSKVQKVDNGRAVSMINIFNTGGTDTFIYAIFIDAIGAPSFGSTFLLSQTASIQAIQDLDESNDGCVGSSSVNDLQYFKWNTVGASATAPGGALQPSLNSSSVGAFLRAGFITPFTVSGVTITVGTAVANSDIVDNTRMRGSDASTSLLFILQDGKEKGCKVV